MAHEERQPFDLVVEVKEGLVELRTRAGHVETELSELRKDFRTELGELRQDLRTELGELRQDLRTELGELRQDFRAEVGELRQDVRRLDSRLFQLLLAQVATLATAMGALVAVLAG